jgi:hypothetical protein
MKSNRPFSGVPITHWCTRCDSEPTRDCRMFGHEIVRAGPFAGNRDDWQTPGPSGPLTHARRRKMVKPPFEKK